MAFDGAFKLQTITQYKLDLRVRVETKSKQNWTGCQEQILVLGRFRPWHLGEIQLETLHTVSLRSALIKGCCSLQFCLAGFLDSMSLRLLANMSKLQIIQEVYTMSAYNACWEVDGTLWTPDQEEHMELPLI